MNILSIIAQKPYSTGSGVYLVETMKEFEKMGHKNYAVFACYEKDYFNFGFNVKTYSVLFDTDKMPFHIFGMSDTMPYQSMRYNEMTDEIFDIWKNKFLDVIEKAVLETKPDIIICHHLYLLTAIVREKYPFMKIYGVCHNTDIRQFIKTDYKRNFIMTYISKLDKIFTPTEYHKNLICKLYNTESKKVEVIGIGYNKDIFNCNNKSRKNGLIRFLYVGKVSKKKGVLTLLKAFRLIEDKIDTKKIVLDIVGGAGDINEYNEIKNFSRESSININFLGKKNQTELSAIYNKSDYLIMPTFFDAIPLTMIEAVACGCKIIISNLPGLKEYVENNVYGAYIRYVEMPQMYNADETTDNEIEKFEKRLSDIIYEESNNNSIIIDTPILNNVSWKNVSKAIIN